MSRESGRPTSPPSRRSPARQPLRKPGATCSTRPIARDPSAFDRAAAMSWTQAQVQLRHLGITPDDANLFQRLANRVLFSDPSLRAPIEVLQRNTRGASTLWAHGISGDLPIVLVRIDE